MITAEAVNKLEKKARSEKKADNAISGQVDGNFFIYPYMNNAALTSLLLLNLSHMFIFCYQPDVHPTRIHHTRIFDLSVTCLN